MSEITLMITNRDGVEHKIIAPTDMSMSLMEIIRSFELVEEGTIGICGGIAMCASCHCYIKPHKGLNEISDDEEAMLYESEIMSEKSRLSCQIPITNGLEGLKITIAEESI